MPNFCQITVVGHLGADPETRHTQGGKSVTNCRIAYTPGFGDKKGETMWFSLSIWDKQGERFASWCKKGQAVMVVGGLESQSWEKDGEKKSRLVINVREFVTMERNNDQPADAPKAKKQAPAPKAESSDDIPF